MTFVAVLVIFAVIFFDTERIVKGVDINCNSITVFTSCNFAFVCQASCMINNSDDRRTNATPFSSCDTFKCVSSISGSNFGIDFFEQR